MTRGADEDKNDVPVPRETTVLFGHDSAERAFLAVYRSGRVPHAWLIGGEPGIGKATLAYRIARFVLAEPDPSRVSTADTLALDPAHRTVRRVAVNAHPDLLALERTPGDSGKMRTVITVEQVRRLTTFFGSTAGEGGWRVCIVERRRTQISGRFQRAFENAGGTAAKVLVPAGEPCAGAIAADHPVALPAVGAQAIGAGRCREGGRNGARRRRRRSGR